MKCKMLTGMAGTSHTWNLGEVYEIEDEEAGWLLAAGYAEKAGGSEAKAKAKKTTPIIETATEK